MEDGDAYDNHPNMTVLLENERLPCSSEVIESLWIPTPSPPPFHGDSLSGSTSSMVNFEDTHTENNRDGPPIFPPLDREEMGNEDHDGCFQFHQPEKKRRLSSNQVQFLQRSFEVENKLEPERKIQLAKELGLQPRQVAIWFQNRRARYKTKQLERDYDSLKAGYDKLKVDYDALLKDNEKLKSEIRLLADKLVGREKEKAAKTDPCETLKSSDGEDEEKPISDTVCQSAQDVVCKQEDASSAKSDVFDSDSPHYTDGNYSSFLEPADSSHVFEPDHSDFSQDEDDNNQRLGMGLVLPPTCFPKLEEECYNNSSNNYPPPNPCNMGFQIDDQAFSFWSY